MVVKLNSDFLMRESFFVYPSTFMMIRRLLLTIIQKVVLVEFGKLIGTLKNSAENAGLF